jgi:ubiquitin C-terminal hydrolase
MHHGLTLNSGHYTSFIKNYGNSAHHSSWFHMDDATVTVVDEDEVLDNRDAYMLFYSSMS